MTNACCSQALAFRSVGVGEQSSVYLSISQYIQVDYVTFSVRFGVLCVTMTLCNGGLMQHPCSFKSANG